MIGGWVGPTFHRARIDAGVRLLLPVEGVADGDPRARASLSLWSAGLRGCALVVALTRVEVPLCVGIEGGLLHASGQGALLRTRSVREPYAAASVVVDVHVLPAPRVAVVMGLEGVLPMLRPGVAADDIPIHRVGPAALRVRAGVEIRFR
jgi:hypothetical protein